MSFGFYNFLQLATTIQAIFWVDRSTQIWKYQVQDEEEEEEEEEDLLQAKTLASGLDQ